MKDLFVFGMGFASGWAARANADSLREAAVSLIAAGYRGAERLRMRIETEREFVQDLLAEGRAQYQAAREVMSPEGEESAATDRARVRAA